MFKSKTVFVVGAGASEEAGLPIGKKLTQEIANLVDFRANSIGQRSAGDPQIYELLHRAVREEPNRWANNRLIASARHLAEAMGMAISIDTFLESFSHDPERQFIGKLAIAKAILSAEQTCKFKPINHQPFNIRQAANTWYVSLAQLLFTGVPARTPEVAFQNVSFVVFNYDRCLQVFLTRALEIYFEIDERRAAEILRNVHFFHPYGNLGGIFPDDKPYVPFGAERADLMQIAANINTFSESVRDEDEHAAIRKEIRDAQTLVFLGFAFHDQNMEVLDSPRPRAGAAATKRALATTFGMSQSDSDVVRSSILNMLTTEIPEMGAPIANVFTTTGKCVDLFNEYWRSLTAA